MDPLGSNCLCPRSGSWDLDLQGGPRVQGGTSHDPSDMAFYEEGVVTGEPELMRCFPSWKVHVTGGSTDSVCVSTRSPSDAEGAGGAGLQFTEESEGRACLPRSEECSAQTGTAQKPHSVLVLYLRSELES